MTKWSKNSPRIARKMQDFPPKWQDQAEKTEKITEKLQKGIKKGLTKCGGGGIIAVLSIFGSNVQNLFCILQKQLFPDGTGIEKGG